LVLLVTKGAAATAGEGTAGALLAPFVCAEVEVEVAGRWSVVELEQPINGSATVNAEITQDMSHTNARTPNVDLFDMFFHPMLEQDGNVRSLQFTDV
jgi:hypothetical protein